MCVSCGPTYSNKSTHTVPRIHSKYERTAGTCTRTRTQHAQTNIYLYICIYSHFVCGELARMCVVCRTRAYLSYRKCNSRHRMRTRARSCNVYRYCIVYTRIARAVPIQCRESSQLSAHLGRKSKIACAFPQPPHGNTIECAEKKTRQQCTVLSSSVFLYDSECTYSHIYMLVSKLII